MQLVLEALEILEQPGIQADDILNLSRAVLHSSKTLKFAIAEGGLLERLSRLHESQAALRDEIHLFLTNACEMRRLKKGKKTRRSKKRKVIVRKRERKQLGSVLCRAARAIEPGKEDDVEAFLRRLQKTPKLPRTKRVSF